MKQLLIILAICGFLVSMPVGLSDCDCGTSGEYQTINTTVGDNAAAVYSIEDLCGLIVPENWWVDAEFNPCISRGGLPESYDWRDIDGVDYTTSIKNQGSCGSCWAFGTIAPLECNILIKTGLEVDLSEQWLVSCNRDGWGCQGGWWAQDYLEWKTDSCGGTGTVLEEDFPYVASNAPCNCPYPHNYLIDDWKFIGSGGGIPSVDSMKQAIIDYGPISVAVAVNSAFHDYPGGVFSGPTSSNINHAIALVGWDDTQGSNGVWFLRNSWGPGWGENGYMRIEYGVCEVGYAACYVDYQLKTEIEVIGGLGVTVDISNVGDEDATDIDWSITVNGGILGFINKSINGNIPLIKPDETEKKTVIPFGLGPITITVTAEPSNTAKVTKMIDALMLFGLVMPISN